MDSGHTCSKNVRIEGRTRIIDRATFNDTVTINIYRLKTRNRMSEILKSFAQDGFSSETISKVDTAEWVLDQTPSIFKVPYLPSKAELLSKIKALKAELKIAKNGTHPYLKKLSEQTHGKQVKDLENIDIYQEIAQKRIDTTYEDAMTKNRNTLDLKIKGNKEEYLQKLNEEELRVIAEFENSELNHHFGPAPPTASRPKRRAHNVGFASPSTTNGTDRAHSGQKEPKVKKQSKITSIESIRFLLTDDQIGEDLQELKSASEQSEALPYRVTIAVDNQRLVYDGKIVPKFIPITIKSLNSEPYSAMILSISEDIVTFRAITPGDTRMSQVSFKDLSSGLIKILKTKL